MSEPGGAVAILDLRIDAGEGRRTARFDLSWQGRTAGPVLVDLTSLGVAPAAASYSAESQPRDLARGPRPEVAGVLASLVEGVPAGLPLALRFGRPSGVLPLLPWERWLTAPLGRPLLRWPYLPVRPAAPPDGPLEIAVCGSVPVAKEVFQLPDLVRTTVAELRDNHPWFHLHVFADAELEGELRSRLGSEVQRGEVRVVPPASAAPFGAARRRGSHGSETAEEEGTGVDSPWLRWLLAEAPPRLDLALFLCHGYLANGRGHLALAESPLSNRDPQWSRFVGRRQLVSFLDACGARALALCSPPGNWSVSGLLGLADEVARERPGPTLVHDFEADPQGLALGRTVALLVRRPGSGAPPLGPSPEVALYAPADLLGAGADEAERRPVSPRLASALGVAGAASAREATEQLYARIASRTAPPGPPRSTPPPETWRGDTFEPEPWRGRDEESDEGAAEVSRGSYSLGTEPEPEPEPRRDRPRRGEPGPAAPRTTPTAPTSPAPQLRREAASQRVLERYAADIATQAEPVSERAAAVQEGRARALSYVLDLLDKESRG